MHLHPMVLRPLEPPHQYTEPLSACSRYTQPLYIHNTPLIHTPPPYIPLLSSQAVLNFV